MEASLSQRSFCRQGKRTNLTFMDEHAEFLRAEQTLLSAKEEMCGWNRTNESIRNRFRPNPYHVFHPKSYFADEGWSP